ncbi:MAG TPA: hypothetical protein VD994_13125, partial [Prosthecobacter sp.]|nr:hypothetical protein [Prosthecobacter sp.]
GVGDPPVSHVKNPSNVPTCRAPFSPFRSPQNWPASQLHHVETELLKEYPNLPRHLIHKAVTLAQAPVDPSQGTVRLLAHTRRRLGIAGSGGNPREIGGSYGLPA